MASLHTLSTENSITTSVSSGLVYRSLDKQKLIEQGELYFNPDKVEL